MAQPLSAAYRLVLEIAVSGRTHKQRFYAEASPSIASADGYYLFDRLGLATIQPRDAAQVWWNTLKGVFHTTVNAPPWVLEQRTGSAWNTVATGTTTGAGTSTVGIQLTTQFTISMRTTDFQRIRMVILESDQFELGVLLIGSSGLAAHWSSLASRLDGTAALGNQMFDWVRSRNKKMIADSGAIISGAYDLNDAVRRARGAQ